MATLTLLSANYEQNNAGWWDAGNGPEGTTNDEQLMCGPLIQGNYVGEIRFEFDKKVKVKSLSVKTSLKGDSYPYSTRIFFSSTRYMPNKVNEVTKTYISGIPSTKGQQVPNSWSSQWTGNVNGDITWTINFQTELIMEANETYYIYLYPSTTSKCSIDGKKSSVTLTGNFNENVILTLEKTSGVSSFTGGGEKAYGTIATTTAIANTGYHLTQYTGDKADGTPDGSWTDCANLNSHETQWTMNANRTIKVHASANTYSIQYEKNAPNNEFTVNGTMNNSSHTYDTAKNLTANAYTCDGFAFTGWNTQADGKGTSYANSASVTNLTSTNGATVTLYAQWDPNHVNIYENTTNGFKPYDIYIYNGSSWDQYVPFIYDGSKWVPYN